MLIKTIKQVSAVLLALLMLSSCGNGEPVAHDTTTTSDTTVKVEVTTTVTEATVPAETTVSIADMPMLDVVKNGASDFKVIISDDAADEVSVAAIHLRKALNSATGANIGLTSDLVNRNSTGEKEILVGLTNRAASKEFKKTLTGEMFGIKVTESSILIAATHEDFIPLAVDYFLENYMENSDYVTMSDGNYSISTAAGVSCQGTLADLTNIRPDTHYATISELVGNVPREGNFKALQGGCVTEKYAYMAVLNTTDYDTKDAGAYIYKISTETWKVVKRSGVLMLAHANDITYNPATNQLFVAHCYVNNKQISIIDADTLKLVGTIFTDNGIYALDYHAPTNTFIGGQGKSGTIFFKYANNGKMLLTSGKITPMATKMVTQGICRDDKYAYHVMFSTAADEPYNTIIIYDLETRKLAHNVRLSISDQEPENISLLNGAFYVGCNPKSGSNKLDIYKSVLYEFDFDTTIPIK